MYRDLVTVGSLLFTWVVLSGSWGYAHQPKSGQIYATVGPFVHQTYMRLSKDDAHSPPSAGIAFKGEADLSEHGGFEGGIFYYEKTYQRIFGASLVVDRVRRVEVPLGYRYWFFSWFSAAFSFSTSFSTGEPRQIYSNVVNGDQLTSARDIAEYLVSLSLQGDVWTKDKLSIVLDARYSYTLVYKPGEDANMYGALVGLKYRVQ